ncbi:hypothetical protein M8C21_006042, partial [Ambrosia artemisiifolia]
ILSYLSKGNKLKQLAFFNDNRSYKLPASFFSLQGLESIHLQYCTFVPPLTFNRFSSLTSLTFVHVEVSAQMLQRFLSECPLLEHIHLNGYPQCIEFVEKGNKFTFVDLLRCVPLIKNLNISIYYMKYLCAGGMPHKLPTSLVHLKYLFLKVCMTEQNEISSALCMIRSSPLLVKIVFLMYDNKGLRIPQTSISFLDPEDYSNLKLDHLDMFEIKMVSSKLPLAMDLVKLIMAKSPVLKTVRIELKDVSVDDEVKMLRDLLGYQQGIEFVEKGNKFTFVDLLRCVPLIITLNISVYYMKYLCAGGMPHKLPTSVVHLKYLFLDVCMTKQNEISSALCMIRSSPLLVKIGGMPHKLPTSLFRLKYLYLHVCLAEKNEISSALCMIKSSPFLEEIDFLMYDNEKVPAQQTPTNFLEPENYPDMNLDYLVAFWVENFRNLPLEVEFVKLIMAKSPVLKKVQIKLNNKVSVDEELKMLKDMLRLPFPRASPFAELSIVRP